MRKKFLACLLAVCMLLSVLPVTAMAANTELFTDVESGTWYADKVQWAYEEGLMVGVGDNLFAPDTTTTRGMVVATLWRMDGAAEPTSDIPFKDVEDDMWYSKAVAWAAENELAFGYGDKLFGPEDEITREQLAAILFRYVQYKEYNIGGETEDLGDYKDADAVSSWAKTAMQWAVADGILVGVSEDTLAPQDDASRAQLATVLYRLVKNVVDVQTEDEGESEDEPTPEPSPSTKPEEPTPSTKPEHTHTWGEGVVTTEPTCGEKGVMTYTCSCGETKTEEIEATGEHVYGACVENGDGTHSKSCACGDTVTEACSDADNDTKCECGSYVVDTTEELQTVINEAVCAETILVKAGTYGEVDFRSHNTRNDNLTIVGEEGATVGGIYVTVHEQTAPKNLTIKNIAFNGKGVASNNIAIEGWTVVDCDFTGSARVGLCDNEIKGLTVESCTFTDIEDEGETELTAIYVPTANGLTVAGCTFDGVEFNAVQVTNVNGEVEISGNTISDTGDRVFRFGTIFADAKLTISGNTIVSSGDADGELAKATAVESGATITFSGNTWNGESDEVVLAKDPAVIINMG